MCGKGEQEFYAEDGIKSQTQQVLFSATTQSGTACPRPTRVSLLRPASSHFRVHCSPPRLLGHEPPALTA